MKILVQDIAKKANVSAGTVSNALNNKKGISSTKREQILEIAHEMGYFKNNDRYNTIRFIVVNKSAHVVADTPFFSELIKGIQIETSANGYELLITHMNLETISKHEIEDVIKPDLIAGAIVLATELNNKDMELFFNLPTPIVFIDNLYKSVKCDCVAINNESAAYDIVAYLIAKGHKNIGLINSVNQINNFRERKIGYEMSLIDHGLMMYPENEALVEPSLEGSYSDMMNYLKNVLKEGKELPTAYFAVNDFIAIGAQKAINKLVGVGKISLVGFDDLPICDFCNPPLTTIQVDKQYIGKVTVRRLAEKIRDKDSGILKILVDSQIVERESVFDMQ